MSLRRSIALDDDANSIADSDSDGEMSEGEREREARHMESMLHNLARRSPPPNILTHHIAPIPSHEGEEDESSGERHSVVEYEPLNLHDCLPETVVSEKQKATAAKMGEVFENMHEAGKIDEGTLMALMGGAQIVHNSVPLEVWGMEHVRLTRMRDSAMCLADKYCTLKQRRLAANNDGAMMDQAAQYSGCMKDLYCLAQKLTKENAELRNLGARCNKRVAEDDTKREDMFRKCRRIADKFGLALGEER